MSGTIFFHAEILEETMTIPQIRRAIEDTPPAEEEIYIEMGKVSCSAFVGSGSTANAKSFAIPINNDFDAQTVRITFKGWPSADNLSLATSNSTVNIVLQDSMGRKVSPENGYYYPLQPGENVLCFICALEAAAGEILCGPVDAASRFSLEFI